MEDRQVDGNTILKWLLGNLFVGLWTKFMDFIHYRRF